MDSIHQSCSPQEAHEAWTNGSEHQLVDVREPSEFSSLSVPGSQLVPLSRLEQQANTVDASRRTYLLCRSGKRAEQASKRLKSLGFQDLWIVEGGMLAWQDAGLPVKAGQQQTWSLERQVRFTAGSLVALGVGLSFLWPPMVFLAGFIGLGLIFAAVTDTCGMGMVLARMPWNQVSTASPTTSSS